LSENDPDLGGRVLQIAELTKISFPIDALIIVLLCVAAAAVVVAPLLNLQMPRLPALAPAGLGALATIVGVANLIRIMDQASKAEDALKGIAGGVSVDVSVGIGVYVTIVGAAAIAVCSFLDYQQRSKAGGAPPPARPANYTAPPAPPAPPPAQ
jgi:hypothetical protein